MGKPIKLSNYTDMGTKNKDVEDHARMVDKDLGNAFQYLSQVSKTYYGAVVPTITPVNIGDHYINTATKKVYVATGTSSSSDWAITN